MKTCSVCLEQKSLDEFYPRSTCRDGKAPECKPCSRARNRRYHASHPEKSRVRARRWIRFRRYNVSQEQFDELLRQQGGACAICKRIGASRALCVDHDHTSGKVRALLCHGCNTALGLLQDDLDVARAVVKYLANYKG